MNSREKLLAIAVGGLVALVALRAAVSYINESFSERENSLATAQKGLRDKQLEEQEGLAAARSIKAWAERSLPNDRNIAVSLYQKWLLKISDNAGIRKVNLVAQSSRNSSEGMRMVGSRATQLPYEQVGFALNGSASLAEIVRFLYDFYSADHLQRIASLNIAPIGDGNLQLELKIEALILDGTSRTDSLNSAKSNRLAFGDLQAYEKSIVGRDLFTEYKPPPPPPRREDVVRQPPPPPVFDKAKYATLTGIVEKGNRPQLWISVKTTGERLVVSEGEEFTVGKLTCKVVRIDLRDAELAISDRHFVLKLQDNLRDAAATAKSSEL
ncbi:MAG: hypothetical protein IT427_18865 [Pirellulales bacterium]|nr:hypothetical protein [Pirellulales bacterium]